MRLAMLEVTSAVTIGYISAQEGKFYDLTLHREEWIRSDLIDDVMGQLS